MLTVAEIQTLKNDLRDFYDNFPAYSLLESYKQQNFIHSDYKFKKYIMDLINEEDIVLDVGSSAGLISLEMARIGKSVRGIDISDLAVKFSRQLKTIEIRRYKLLEDLIGLNANTNKLSSVEFSFGDAEKLPFEKNQFSFILAKNVIEHLPAPIVAINEMFRCLKPEGTLVLIINTPDIDTNLNITAWKNDIVAMQCKDALSKMNFNVMKIWLKRKKIKIKKYDIEYNDAFSNLLTTFIPYFKGVPSLESYEKTITLVLKKS